MTARDGAHIQTRPEVPTALLQLVNSVIWPGFVGTTVPAWLDQALLDGLAGVVYFTHNIDPDSPTQVAALSAAIRSANPGAVIGVDEEGGNVTRLQARDGSTVPGAAVLGALDDLSVTEAAGREIGRLCHEAGINLTIAPVADVNTNPLNPVIGVRAFGSNTALVSRHTAAAVTGIQSAGVGACAKHFPGHGDTVADSHMGTARLELGMDEITAHHLPPFHAAFDAGVASVMSAHIIIPELSEAPATLNPAMGALLRGTGFDGLLITDALDMAAIRATVGAGEGAVLSMLAGADLLCVGNPLNDYSSGGNDFDCYVEVRDALIDAASSGRLPLEVLQTARARVAAFAQWSADNWGAGDDGAAAGSPYRWVDAAEQACTVEATHGPATLPAGTTDVVVVDARTEFNMAAGPTANFFAQALSATVTVHERTPEALLAGLVPADLPVIAITDALTSAEQQQTLAAVAALAEPGAGTAADGAAAGLAPVSRRRVVAINAGLLPMAQERAPLSTIHCHGSSRVSAAAVARLLLAGA
ncbi:glycoside hydrolase family 3 protein [Arthrobacter sp. 35W]|uniref:glycoside hydrolase family 3 protein n=1 Tax=Arthrobacter sp. 35W TaxID=1132441 RepID=UPI0009DDE1E6|nr:glycoside hydrolase family 3 N-terminal domain-containing protein [Arthrobacter sp. 35W]